MESKENQVTISINRLRSLIGCETTLDIMGVMLAEKYPNVDLMRHVLGVEKTDTDV